VGGSIEDVGSKVTSVIEATGQKPSYIVVSYDQHQDMLMLKNNVKIKQGRVLKFKGMSVVVTL
jgi:hypothetical protein